MHVSGLRLVSNDKHLLNTMGGHAPVLVCGNADQLHPDSHTIDLWLHNNFSLNLVFCAKNLYDGQPNKGDLNL